MAQDTAHNNAQNHYRYGGILYKRSLLFETEQDFISRLRQTTLNEIRIQHVKKRVGNNEGLHLLDRLEDKTRESSKMEAQILEIREMMMKTQAESQKAQAESQKIWAENREIRAENSFLEENRKLLRFGVLEGRRKFHRNLLFKDPETMRVRNDIAHGGDLVGDIKAIECARELGIQHVSAYIEDFRKAYGVEFDEVVRRVASYPKEVVKAFDIRASVRELDRWQFAAAQKNKAIIESRADSIINAASDTEIDDIQARFQKQYWRKTYNQMYKLFVTDN